MLEHKGFPWIHGVLFVLVSVTLAVSCGKKNLIDRSQGVDPGTELRTLVARHIADPDKRAQILEIIVMGEARFREFHEFYGQHNERMADLANDYNTTRGEFDEATEEFNARYREILMGMVSDRFAMRELMTPEEWALISDREHSVIGE